MKLLKCPLKAILINTNIISFFHLDTKICLSVLIFWLKADGILENCHKNENGKYIEIKKSAIVNLILIILVTWLLCLTTDYDNTFVVAKLEQVLRSRKS